MRKRATRLLFDVCQRSVPDRLVPDDSAIPAHLLWVELRTRIDMLCLPYWSGDEEASANSIYELFKITHNLIVSHPEAEKFQTRALSMLNEVVRPYSARWHGWMTKDSAGARFPDESTRRQFRQESQELQARLAVRPTTQKQSIPDSAINLRHLQLGAANEWTVQHQRAAVMDRR